MIDETIFDSPPFDEVKEYKTVFMYLIEGPWDCGGTYQYDWRIYGDKLVVAKLDSNEMPLLTEYDIEHLKQWEINVLQFLKDEPEEFHWEAVISTEPGQEL